MDAQSLYYIKKYNDLKEQINKLKHENNLLEGLASGTLSGSERDTTTSSSTTTSAPPSNPPSTPTNPTTPTPYSPDINGDGVVDGADLGAMIGNWDNPYGGAELGSLLSYWGQNPNPNPTEPETPTNPTNPTTPTTPTTPSYKEKGMRGTSTKDIATLSGRNIYY